MEMKRRREFQEKFGKKEEVGITIGDWEQKQHGKFKELVKREEIPNDMISSKIEDVSDG